MSGNPSARELVRQKIAQDVAAFDGRVFEPEMADPTGTFPSGDAYPYAVVRLGVEPEMTPWGYRVIPLEVWPYVQPDSYQDLDSLGAAIDAAIAWQLFQEPSNPDGRYYCVPLGSAGYDAPEVAQDGHITAITRPRRYGLATVNRGLGTAHPVLDAVVSYVHTQFPSLQVGLDLSGEVPSDAAPAVLFRFASLPAPGDWLTVSFRWFSCQIAGHILAPSPATREQWAVAVNLALGRVMSIPFLDDSTSLQLNPRPGSVTADPLADGQLRIDAQYALDAYSEDDGAVDADLVEHIVVGPAPVAEADAPV